VLSEAREIFEADVGWMTAGDPADPAFVPLFEGADPGEVDRLRRAVEADLVERGKSHIFYSVRGELGLEGGGLPETLLCASVKTETAVYGALCIGRRGRDRLFTARDLKLSSVLASQAAFAIENRVLQRRRLEEEQALVRMEEELRLAREIQSSLLPRSAPAIPGYDIACRGVPALSVGGDYYDVIPIDGSRVALCVADVSGHGMPAALLMANLQATIRSQALAAVSPAECLTRSNRLLFRNTDAGRFATCFYGVLEHATGRLAYTNAGHDHPLLVRGDGSQDSLTTGGLVLGVREESAYEEGALALEPGSVLVIYSDGVTETFNAHHHEFGVDGLRAAVARSRDDTAARILEEILEAADAHANGNPRSDDMTLMVLRRL
jgi:sigma-B regulation protein RsbU (phosphoserine phosphatase)